MQRSTLVLLKLYSFFQIFDIIYTFFSWSHCRSRLEREDVLDNALARGGYES